MTIPPCYIPTSLTLAQPSARICASEPAARAHGHHVPAPPLQHSEHDAHGGRRHVLHRQQQGAVARPPSRRCVEERRRVEGLLLLAERGALAAAGRRGAQRYTLQQRHSAAYSVPPLLREAEKPLAAGPKIVAGTSTRFPRLAHGRTGGLIGAPARWTNKAVCRGQEGQSGGGGHPWAGLAEAERSSARFAPEKRSSLRTSGDRSAHAQPPCTAALERCPRPRDGPDAPRSSRSPLCRPSNDYIIRSRHGTSPENPQYPSKTDVSGASGLC